MVMPPEHEPQILTSSLPVMSRITSTASSSAADIGVEPEMALARRWDSSS